MERGVLKRRMHRGASLHFDCRNRIPKRPEDRNPSASSPAGGALTGALRPQGWIWVEMSACHCLNPRRHSFRGLRWRCGWRSRPRGSSSGRSSDSLLPFVGPAMPSRRLFQTGHQWLSSRLSRTGVRRPFSCAASAPCSLRSGTAPGAASGKAHSSGTVGDSHPVPFSTSSRMGIWSPGELSRPKGTKNSDTCFHKS